MDISLHIYAFDSFLDYVILETRVKVKTFQQLIETRNMEHIY